MLNELSELSKSLKTANIPTDSWHKNYGVLPNRSTYRFFINKASHISSIVKLNREQIVGLRKWEVSNGHSFPAFNIMPLFSVNVDKSNAKLTPILNNIFKDSYRWTLSEIEKLESCLNLKSKDLLDILGDIPPEYNSIRELIARSQKIDIENFREDIKIKVLEYINNHPDESEEWINTIIAVKKIPNKKQNPKSFSVVLELDNYSNYKYPANHEKVIKWINSRLLDKDKNDENGNSVDAYGNPTFLSIIKDKLPDVNKVGSLGNVILRAMNKESPCQYRYGMIDAESFPIGKEARQDFKNALEWLRDINRKGKTWQDISKVCGYNAGILFCYPNDLPENPPELALLFTGNNSIDNTTLFEDVASGVTKSLYGIVKDKPGVEIIIFCLAKVDTARTKVLVSRNITAHSLIKAAEEWNKGCKNIPSMKINIGNQNNNRWISNRIPYPSEIVDVLNKVWIRNGTENSLINHLPFTESLYLMIGNDYEIQLAVTTCLRLLQTNSLLLLLALGHAIHKSDGDWFNKSKFKKDLEYHASILPSIMGLLLYKLNIKKGDYMHTAPYLVGRMLSLTDTLHKEYCKYVRKGDIPPQLIGNALMPTALDNPLQGIDRLTKRLLPYQAWANRFSGEDAGLAKWSLKKMGEISKELSQLTLPKKTNDADRAEMLLGYLASFESEKENNP